MAEKTYWQKYYAKNKDRYKTYEWNTPEANRRRKLKYKYNITPEDYDKMYLNQEGKCAICNDKHNKLNIDHCHTTGKVRGLLCTNCNQALGKVKDNIDILKSAIEYLKLSNNK